MTSMGERPCATGKAYVPSAIHYFCTCFKSKDETPVNFLIIFSNNLINYLIENLNDDDLDMNRINSFFDGPSIYGYDINTHISSQTGSFQLSKKGIIDIIHKDVIKGTNPDICIFPSILTSKTGEKITFLSVNVMGEDKRELHLSYFIHGEKDIKTMSFDEIISILGKVNSPKKTIDLALAELALKE